ncbi:hypothetical protein CO026_03315 [Candidatus Kaiserbacteria bacterium CG_4_9_14_0_2_um_filter_41_32]|uniref:FAD-binding PCMH-type domain-containing protein n=1 Tax=Candidatus Kaiserbacteria bacterium CG_4_9_14_0_2_um_filter_41_32 TaxID=1974601 RepID=A0A2M8FE20_9BACT|nr:MAG: hypothetical protein CO026_03315 [Candidatus Kaiserbacteria bacterium CG_4_9_14_0_2_um_filter_41_32]
MAFRSLTIVDVDAPPVRHKRKTTTVAKKTKTIRSAKVFKKTTKDKKTSIKKTTDKTVSIKLEPYKHFHNIPTLYDTTIRPGFLTGIKRHPLGHLLLEKKLRQSGFDGGISTDKKFLDKYSTDESIFCIRPQVVLQPKNIHDIEISTKLIAVETKRFSSLSLTPRAAGTGLSGGSLTDSIVIDVSAHLNKIGAVKESKNQATITCEPGAMWGDVEKKLKKYNFYIPAYPSSKDICTVGGSIANNAAGPDSLRYGHCASWVDSLEVVLADGNTYTIKPLSYKEFKTLDKQKNEYARIVREVFSLIEKNEKTIISARPKTAKNTAGYALWDVIPDGVESFKKGKGVMDITRLISGSQGTIGIISSITMRAILIDNSSTLITVPLFKIEDVAKAITVTLKYNPLNIEIFDGTSFDLALKNPEFFKKRLQGLDYYRAVLAMYMLYHMRYRGKSPEFTLLITIDKTTEEEHSAAKIAADISMVGVKARIVRNPAEAEILWQIRRASYPLAKFQDPSKRPAPFLEDMTVPPENLSRFLLEIKKLFKEFNVQAAMHGHGGNGHFHFYPLLDFTNKTTPLLVERMAERFYSVAVKYHGDICGEHNDGIIRTPYLNKMFNKQTLELFKQVEHIFDPDDIFNPGKKVNPRFDIKTSMRRTN